MIIVVVSVVNMCKHRFLSLHETKELNSLNSVMTLSFFGFLNAFSLC